METSAFGFNSAKHYQTCQFSNDSALQSLHSSGLAPLHRGLHVILFGCSSGRSIQCAAPRPYNVSQRISWLHNRFWQALKLFQIIWSNPIPIYVEEVFHYWRNTFSAQFGRFVFWHEGIYAVTSVFINVDRP